MTNPTQNNTGEKPTHPKGKDKLHTQSSEQKPKHGERPCLSKERTGKHEGTGKHKEEGGQLFAECRHCGWVKSEGLHNLKKSKSGNNPPLETTITGMDRKTIETAIDKSNEDQKKKFDEAKHGERPYLKDEEIIEDNWKVKLASLLGAEFAEMQKGNFDFSVVEPFVEKALNKARESGYNDGFYDGKQEGYQEGRKESLNFNQSLIMNEPDKKPKCKICKKQFGRKWKGVKKQFICSDCHASSNGNDVGIPTGLEYL
jgi:hypothetical protein